MRRRRSLVLLAGLVVAAVLAGCGGDDGTAGPTPSTSAPAAPSTAAPSTTPSSIQPTSTTPPSTTPPSTAPPPTTASTTTSAAAGPAVEVRRGSTSRRAVALTFDAGSDAGFAAQILDTLDVEGVTASFGLTGRWAEEHPALVRRMADAGHLLINHSYDHPSFSGLSTGAAPLDTAERHDQLRRAEAAIVRAGGVAARPWFRPPYGDTDASVLADLGTAGYRWSAMWTVDSLGWRGIPAGEITQRCLDGAEPGAILLFHVGSASADAAALPAIIAGLRGAGYEMTTVADLVGAA